MSDQSRSFYSSRGRQARERCGRRGWAISRGLPFAFRFAKPRITGCYMATRALVAVGLLIFAVAFPVSSAAADPIIITSGSMTTEGVGAAMLGIVNIQGTQGFEAQLRVDPSFFTGACRAAPGGFAGYKHGVFFAAMGVAPFGWAVFRIPFTRGGLRRPTCARRPGDIAPISARATLTAPFELDLGFSALFLQDVGGVQRFPLVGSGTVTIELVP